MRIATLAGLVTAMVVGATGCGFPVRGLDLPPDEGDPADPGIDGAGGGGAEITVGSSSAGPGPSGSGGGAVCAGESLDVLLAGFAACMSFQDWQALELDDLGEVGLAGAEDIACNSCHGSAIEAPSGVVLGAANETFKAHQHGKQLRYLARGDGSDECSTDLSFTDGYTELGMSGAHPAFDFPPLLTEALASFFTATYGRWKDGACQQE